MRMFWDWSWNRKVLPVMRLGVLVLSSFKTTWSLKAPCPSPAICVSGSSAKTAVLEEKASEAVGVVAGPAMQEPLAGDDVMVVPDAMRALTQYWVTPLMADFAHDPTSPSSQPTAPLPASVQGKPVEAAVVS